MTPMAKLLAVVLLALTGCDGIAPPACVAGTGKPMQVYQLYFGRNIETGGFVTDLDWKTFRETAIAPSMPDGFTVLDAEGAWAAPDGHRTMTDPTKILIVAMPNGPDGLAAVTRVRHEYQNRFSQDQVGMIVQPGCGLF